MTTVPNFRVPVNQVLKRHARILVGKCIARISILDQIPSITSGNLSRLSRAWWSGGCCSGSCWSRFTKSFNAVRMIGKEIVASPGDRRILFFLCQRFSSPFLPLHKTKHKKTEELTHLRKSSIVMPQAAGMSLQEIDPSLSHHQVQ